MIIRPDSRTILSEGESKDRLSCPFGESNPNRSSTLSRDLVKGQRRKQADCSFRDSFRDLSIGVVFRHVGAGKCVDSRCRPIEFALPVETKEILPRKADGLDIAGPYNPVFADVLHNNRALAPTANCAIG